MAPRHNFHHGRAEMICLLVSVLESGLRRVGVAARATDDDWKIDGKRFQCSTTCGIDSDNLLARISAKYPESAISQDINQGEQ